jgi:hypothetical protein
VAESRLRTILLLAGAGAVLALIGIGGIAVELVGLGLMILGTVLSAPAAPKAGEGDVNWWALLGVGTLLAAIGIPLALGVELVGGLLTAIGGVLVVVGAALGY